ncbi:YwiC-like family protein [Streptomyces sp. Ag109_G2-6]|uniref:YwiC-like family protein n=1 Tax=Streptomyces sp. Ag109_G2-6 TaxID=2485154 RepID=UPI000F501D8B|nr:YwiC-like family protein [Streptomyces sp. Ag109_G2-6]
MATAARARAALGAAARVPAVVYGTAAGVCALPLALLHPWLLLAAAAALPFVAVNTSYA